MVEAERITDSHYPLADFYFVGVAQRRHRQVVLGIDFQQRDVGLGVASGHRGLVLIAVHRGDDDLAAVFDHVIVGQDVAGRD